MDKNSKWYLAGICLIGVVIGIVLVGALTSVVHWAGTEKFCGEFCHSMDTTYTAYQKGQHFRTASGMTAGCSDCHLKYHSNEHVGPIDYVAMLWDKAKSGTSSFFGEVRGTMSTPEKQVAKRKELSEKVHKHMVDQNFSTCRGCHDLSRMYNPKKPAVAAFHKGFIEKPADCLACHPTAGHNYAAPKTAEAAPAAK
ncbi:MAG: Cytochrome c-type protein [Burkholderia sp.]|jgi:nitrate/TMAO reductase-like tetraheme cytochrome c subunit